MPDYDFTACLSPLDFERLSKDLLEAELGIHLESFSEGRDKGIDLRYAPARRSSPDPSKRLVLTPTPSGATLAPPQLIVQCKRYSHYSDLKHHLKNTELPKVTKLSPDRYILTTSVALSPQQVDELKSILSPYVQSTGDIYGRERLNSILRTHQEVERRHVKLWVSSAGVLDSIVNAGTHVVSREEVERTMAAAKIYVRNPSFDEALEILKTHRVCIISGLPGIGKTTLARMLLLYFYKREYDIVKIESDISEARRLGYHNRPRFYYYDDFLGQTTQADKLNKNEDQKLLDFLRSVQDSKDSVFVLTTREYILNQARMHYEKLDRENFGPRTCVIDLSKYSRRIRAHILYNHLHFSDLPPRHLEYLIAQRGYLAIVDHNNYNPRLIEYLTSASWVGAIRSSQYLPRFLATLDNPAAIWNHAFRYQLSPAARHLLFVLTTLPTETRLHSVELAFDRFHSQQCDRCGIEHSAADVKRALKELDGTFLGTRQVGGVVLLRFQNPSIRDFMQNVLLGGELLAEVIESLVFFEQAQWFCDTLRNDAPQISLTELATHSRSIADTMQKLFAAGGCEISIVGPKESQCVLPERLNPASRLERVASFVSSFNEVRDVEFVTAQIADLTTRLESGRLGAGGCLSAVKSLGALGHLSTQEGQRFANAIKVSATNEPSDLDEYRILADVIDTFPESFTPTELEDIGESFVEFADEYASDCEKGRLYIDDPDVIREEANRIDDLGSRLGVDTEAAQATLRAYAEEREEEAERGQQWETDDGEWRGGGGKSENCSDAELDSIFGTLGH